LNGHGNVETSRKFDGLVENRFTCREYRSAFSWVVVQPFPAFGENIGTRCISEEFANITTPKSHMKREIAGREDVVDCVWKIPKVHGALRLIIFEKPAAAKYSATS
jgi:hypothetical protein